MYTMKKIAVMMMAGLLSFMPGTDAWAQRQQQTLGRGVVAVRNGSNVFLSWRRLAQEPEDAMYNVYVDGKKINPSPLSRTNYKTASSAVPAGSDVSVTVVSQGTESEPGVLSG